MIITGAYIETILSLIMFFCHFGLISEFDYYEVFPQLIFQEYGKPILGLNRVFVISFNMTIQFHLPFLLVRHFQLVLQ
jgi:hypothetical protein